MSYFWVNPNHAAAVLVALLAFFWALRFHLELRRWKIGVYGIVAGLELFWSFLIGWTCSRGALVAWVAALGFFGFLQTKASQRRGRDVAIFWILSAGFFLMALLATGTGRRFADIAAGDRSALNRLGIWSDALKLIHAAPLSGWGAGNSGNAMLQWFLPVESTKEYAAVVGTYLHFSAEFGLPMLILMLAMLLMTLRRSCETGKLPGWRKMIVTASASGLFAFMTAGLFSTLWVNVWTSGVALLLALMVWAVAGRSGSLSIIAGWRCVALAVMAGTAIYGAGAYAASSDRISVRKVSGGVVLSKTRERKSEGRAILLLDRLVLGTFYGRPVRQIVDGLEDWETVWVYLEKAPTSVPAGTQVLAFGPRIVDLPKEVAERAIAICPVGPYVADKYGVPAMVVLPAYDEFGFAAEWARAVRSAQKPFNVLPDTGQDCSARMEELTHILAQGQK